MNQPFIGHVHELKRRLFRSALVVFLVAGLAYFWHGQILGWLEAPLRQTLYYSRVTGAFEFIVQACLLTGLLAAAPILLYEMIAFIRPALPRPIKMRTVVSVIIMAMILIFGGVAFGYYISLPAALNFLGTIDASHLHPLLAADSYLTFVMNYLAVFGLVFLLPLLIMFYDSVSPLPPSKMVAIRKWIIVGAFAAALILPIAPDPISQVLLALPLIVMYEFSIICLRIRHWGHRSPQSTPLAVEPAEITPLPTQSAMVKSAPKAKPAPRVYPRKTLFDIKPHTANVIDLRNHDLSYRQ